MAHVARDSAALLQGLSGEEKTTFAKLLGLADGPGALDQMASDMAQAAAQAAAQASREANVTETAAMSVGEGSCRAAGGGSGIQGEPPHAKQSAVDADLFMASLAGSMALGSAAGALLGTPSTSTPASTMVSAPASLVAELPASVAPVEPTAPQTPPPATPSRMKSWRRTEPSVYALNTGWLEKTGETAQFGAGSGGVPSSEAPAPQLTALSPGSFASGGGGAVGSGSKSSARGRSSGGSSGTSSSVDSSAVSRGSVDMRSLVALAQREKDAERQKTVAVSLHGSGQSVAWAAAALGEPETLMRQRFAEVAAERMALRASATAAEKSKRNGQSALANGGASEAGMLAKERRPAKAASAWDALRKEEDAKRQLFAARTAAAAASAAESSSAGFTVGGVVAISPNRSTAKVAWASLAEEEARRARQFRKRISKLPPPNTNSPLYFRLLF
jgi:hypothetical protein